MRKTRFAVQFEPAQIPSLVDAYRRSMPREPAVLLAGKRIASGEYDLKHLKPIILWKSERTKGRIDDNDERDVRDALRLACLADTERAAVSVLMGLSGVGVPVASAILTAIKPRMFTVIDVRALASLGTQQKVLTVTFYLTYLAECRRLALGFRVSLRDLDRALWQWSKNADQRT